VGKRDAALITAGPIGGHGAPESQRLGTVKSRVRPITFELVNGVVPASTGSGETVVKGIAKPLHHVPGHVVNAERADTVFERVDRRCARRCEIRPFGDIPGVEQAPGKDHTEWGPHGTARGLFPLKQGRKILPTEPAVGLGFMPGNPGNWMCVLTVWECPSNPATRAG